MIDSTAPTARSAPSPGPEPVLRVEHVRVALGGRTITQRLVRSLGVVFGHPFVERALEFLDSGVHPIVVDQEVPSDGPVEALDFARRGGRIGSGEQMADAVVGTDPVEKHWSWPLATVRAVASLPRTPPKKRTRRPWPIPRASAETEVPVSSIPPANRINRVRMRAPTMSVTGAGVIVMPSK